jgi:hypothetical protein
MVPAYKKKNTGTFTGIVAIEHRSIVHCRQSDNIDLSFCLAVQSITFNLHEQQHRIVQINFLQAHCNKLRVHFPTILATVATAARLSGETAISAGGEPPA